MARAIEVGNPTISRLDSSRLQRFYRNCHFRRPAIFFQCGLCLDIAIPIQIDFPAKGSAIRINCLVSNHPMCVYGNMVVVLTVTRGVEENFHRVIFPEASVVTLAFSQFHRIYFGLFTIECQIQSVGTPQNADRRLYLGIISIDRNKIHRRTCFPCLIIKFAINNYRGVDRSDIKYEIVNFPIKGVVCILRSFHFTQIFVPEKQHPHFSLAVRGGKLFRLRKQRVKFLEHVRGIDGIPYLTLGTRGQ